MNSNDRPFATRERLAAALSATDRDETAAVLSLAERKALLAAR